MKVDRIVVGITPEHHSDGAIRRAMRLGRAFDAKVEAVHGVGVGHMRRGIGEAAAWSAHVAATEAHARDACRGKLELLVEDPLYAELPLDDYLTVRPEKGPAALLAHAKEHAADMIVLGGHRRRGLFDFGGTARTILAGAECPVWIQPDGHDTDEAQDVTSVLASVDLSPASDSVLKAAMELAQRFDVPLEVLHVFVPPTFAYDIETGVAAGPSFVIDNVRDEERKELERIAGSYDWSGGRQPAVRQVEGDAVDVIHSRSDARTLVVMGTHGHSGITRAVLGSVAYAVLKGRKGPTLVLPQPSKGLLE